MCAGPWLGPACVPRSKAHTCCVTVSQLGCSVTGPLLPEIAQVLRHRGMTTTEIYAKVDLAGLRVLAQPWPLEGGAQ